MFGTIAAPVSPIEVDADFLVKCIVTHAVTLLENRARARRRALEHVEANDQRMAAVWYDIAGQESASISACTFPLRLAVKDRTFVEELAAARLVESRAAWFYMGSCGDEECGDCDLPMWHHICIVGEGWQCPFGRRFWQVARALGQAACASGHYESVVNIAEVARR